jgi:hypothetical protein
VLSATRIILPWTLTQQFDISGALAEIRCAEIHIRNMRHMPGHQ